MAEPHPVKVFTQLSDQLAISATPILGRSILQKNDGGVTLPGGPLIELNGDKLLSCIGETFRTPELDKMGPWLRYVRKIPELPWRSLF